MDLLEAEDVDALATVVNWCRTFLIKPHPDNGRDGPVCPFCPRGLEEKKLLFRVIRGRPEYEQILPTLIAERDSFMKRVAGDASAMFAATIMVFPDVLTQAQAELVIDETQHRVKPKFVELGLMIGEFHPYQAGPGVHNESFRPLQSPLPLLVIRHMTKFDLGFLNTPKYPMDQRIGFLRAYLSKFDSKEVRETLDELLESQDTENHPEPKRQKVVTAAANDTACPVSKPSTAASFQLQRASSLIQAAPVEEQSPRLCTVLFGTQTGTAEGLALELGKRIADALEIVSGDQVAFRVNQVRVLAMDQYQVTDLPKETVLIVVTSTFGSGQAPVNARAFARWLARAHVAENCQLPLRFSVFGLGSSLFPHFAAFAKQMDQLLCALASPSAQLLPLCCGDEVGVIGGMSQRAAFDNWQNRLFKALGLAHATSQPAEGSAASALRVCELGVQGAPGAGRVSLRVGQSTALALVQCLATTVRGLPTPGLNEALNGAERLLAVAACEEDAAEPASFGAVELLHFFDSLDTTGSGRLSHEELRAGASQLGLDLDDEQLAQIDLNSDGIIEYDELLQIGDRSFNVPKTQAPNCPGSLTPIQLRRLLLAPRVRPASRLYPMFARVLYNVELFSRQSTRSARLVSLGTDSVLNKQLAYAPGDHIACFPQNHPDIVHEACRLLNVSNPDTLLQIECDNSGEQGLALRVLPLPVVSSAGSGAVMQCTWWQLLSCYLDLLKSPTPALCCALAPHCSDPAHATELTELSKGSDVFNTWISNDKPCVLTLLRRFSSLSVADSNLGATGAFLQSCPKMQPRLYSAASSPLAKPGEIHIIVAHHIYRAGTAIRRGVCSDWLRQLTPSSAADNRFAAPVFIARSNFRMPTEDVPVVMIAVGTGVAPFRGFWQHRMSLSVRVGSPMALYFGCRSPDEHIMKDEMEAAATGGVLTKLRVAYSRVGKRQRVTALLAEDEVELKALLSEESRGHLFLCGDIRVGESVKATLSDIGIDVTQLVESGRLHEEVFGLYVNNAKAESAAVQRVDLLSTDNVKGF